MQRISIFITIAGIAVLAMSAFFYLGRLGIGDKAPDFSLPSLDGKIITLKEELDGHPVIVHFWGVFCDTCREGFPDLIKLQKNYKDSGLVILAISEDNMNAEKLAKKFIGNNDLHGIKILMDKDGSVAGSYGSFGVPEDIYIDKSGTITHRSEGLVEWDSPSEKKRIEKLFVK